MIKHLLACLPVLLAAPPLPAQTVSLDLETVNGATYAGGDLPADRSPLTLKLQVLLDRAGASPGVIDGHDGDNVGKAIEAFERMRGFDPDGEIDPEEWAALATDGPPVLVRHTLSDDDVAGPFVASVPEDYGEMARMQRLDYVDVAEKLAERFHMDIDLLHQLNPDIADVQAGDTIIVADPGEPASAQVARLEADTAGGRLLGYDSDDRLVVAYPATIGSRQTPSPAGVHEITAVVLDAAYYYRPDENFRQGDNDQPLTIPPGPNNPVGTVWIDLSEPTYGIHGTPQPSRIDKTYSHGCVRLTNWDAEELAALVEPGVPVDFLP